MSLRDKIYGKLGLVTEETFKREIKNAAQRGFDAAKNSRYREGWKRSRDEFQALKGQWPVLNARVWDARFNNPIIAGELIDNRVNMVGPQGFDYQPMVKLPNGEADEKTNEFLVERFDEWCDEEYCTITKRIPFRMLQYLIADYLDIDGAYIMRMHFAGETVKDNPFGFSLEPLDTADIDYTYNAELMDGTSVIMGTRLDKWGRIVSVFFREKTLYQDYSGAYRNGWKRKEIPYNELLYGIDLIHHKIVTGVTPWVSALIKLKDLDMYTYYHMQNAKWNAGQTAWLETTAADAGLYDGPPTSREEVDKDGNTIVVEEESDYGKYGDLEPGNVEELPYGKKITLSDPKFPHSALPDFVRATGREIASARGNDYAAMFGDREGESYSSGRSGEMKTNNTTAYRQGIFIDTFLTRLTKNWLRFSLANGALKPLEPADFNRVKKHYWQGFFRGWIDPLKQAMTDRINMENGSASLNQTITKSGGRMKDVYEDEKYHKKLTEEYGFDIAKKYSADAKVDETKDDDNADDKKVDEEKRSSGLQVIYKI